MTLDGEIALVTGASRGIGNAIAGELARRGAFVVGTATTEDGASAIAAGLEEEGGAGIGAKLDVTSETEVKQLLEGLEAKSRLPTILVNNAGITRDNLLVRMNEADWAAVIDTNLSSIFRLSRACARPMMKMRRGRIISITSVVGAMGNPGQTNYAAAKAGIMGFTRALARELGPRGITVNAVAPGFIDTDMTRSLPETARKDLIHQIPLHRLGTTQDIAAAVAFLASQDAAYITGATLHVNGGMYMT